MTWRKVGALAALAIGAVALAKPASAAIVNWDIDATQSKITLAIPDTKLNLDGTDLTARVRNQSTASGGNNVWNVGNSAFMDGTLKTNYKELTGNSITFLSHSPGDIVGLNSGNYRPNPAAFNPGSTNAENPDGQFTNTTTAPAVFGARVRASVSILTVDAGFLDIRNVSYDAQSGVLATAGNVNTTQTFNSAAVNFGILNALVDLDGLSIIIVGQPIPDTLALPLALPLALNSNAGGTITNLGGLARKLTVPISIPLALEIEGIVLNMNITGQVVATALVPEPSSLMMAGVGLVGLAVCARRRMRRR
jgi:hypothetical protein